MYYHIHNSIRLKIAYAYSFDFFFEIQLFHCPPCAMHVTIRLVDKIQIQVA